MDAVPPAAEHHHFATKHRPAGINFGGAQPRLVPYIREMRYGRMDWRPAPGTPICWL
jgi:hypothetical protein